MCGRDIDSVDAKIEAKEADGMKQCPNCKCQVGSGVAVCPYCGKQLAVEERFRPKMEHPEYAAAERVRYQRYYARPVQPEAAYPWKPPAGQYVPYYTAAYCDRCPEQRKSQNTLISVLLILLVCLVAANIFELAALLLVI